MNKRELQFENDQVCVWKMVVSPDHPPSEGVIIGLDNHKTYWLPSDLASLEGKEVMMVEMKKPKDRLLPSRPID